MQIGMLLIFQNYEKQLSDADAWSRDLALADLAEPLGYEILSCVEHHFFDYSTSSSNIQLLTYWAARTKRIKLMTGVVILPWNDPRRVMEQMSVLDHLSGGRALFGIGRGLARREYDVFGVDMNESRDRFDQSARIILDGLESGYMEADTPLYKIPRTEIRPQPRAGFRDRLSAVAMSTDSIPSCAELGAQMVCFSQKPWAEMVPHFDTYRELFLKHHGRPAPSPLIADFMLCSESAEEAEELARRHMANTFYSVMEHYEIMGAHFKTMKGYGAYAQAAEEAAEQLKSTALTQMAEGFADINTFGTPQQILDRLESRRALIGDYDYMIQPSFGGLSRRNAERSVRLFADKVMPELRALKKAS